MSQPAGCAGGGSHSSQQPAPPGLRSGCSPTTPKSPAVRHGRREGSAEAGLSGPEPAGRSHGQNVDEKEPDTRALQQRRVRAARERSFAVEVCGRRRRWQRELDYRGALGKVGKRCSLGGKTRRAEGHSGGTAGRDVVVGAAPGTYCRSTGPHTKRISGGSGRPVSSAAEGRAERARGGGTGPYERDGRHDVRGEHGCGKGGGCGCAKGVGGGGGGSRAFIYGLRLRVLLPIPKLY